MLTHFSVTRRSYGHWDFYSEKKRVFRLRGGPSDWMVFDERAAPWPLTRFKDQVVAVAYICSELMFELLTVEGQTPHVMESWNIGPGR